MRTKRCVGAVAVSLALVVAACSGDDDDSSSKAKSKATTTTEATTSTTSSTKPAPPQTATGPTWATYYGDAARTGKAAGGPTAAQAKQQWASPELDGDVYAQPLIVGDRVYVATQNDTVYALNAADGKIAWQKHLAEPVEGSSLPCGNVNPTVGVTSTPVLDTATNRLYVVGMTTPAKHQMFQLDATDGRVVDSTTVDVPGSDAKVQNQRSALTLAGGQVYVPFGGRFGDCGDYHGQITAVAVTPGGLGKLSSYVLPTEREGGWWAPAGAARAADGSLYLAAGNSSSNGQYDYGNSVVRLSPALKLQDSWSPKDWADLNASDGDVGTTSPVLLPGGRIFQVGKAGISYLLDAGHLGGIGGELHQAQICGTAFGAVAHDGNVVYVPCGDAVVQVTVSGNTFRVGWRTDASTPGPTVVAGNAVWAVATGDGQLLALDKASGRQLAKLDIGETPSRFTSPAVAGNRVVVAAARKVMSFG